MAARPGGRGSTGDGLLDVAAHRGAPGRAARRQGRRGDLAWDTFARARELRLLELGVLVARDSDTRAARLATLTRLREQAAGIPIDDRVASAYVRLAARQLQDGRRRRVHDPWIAATSVVHDAAVWTQDADFGALSGVDVVRI